MICKNRLANLRLLLVEDERSLSALLEETIGHYFECFETQSDAPNGLRAFREGSYDLVLADIMMPGGNGLQMAEEIRKIRPETPIVILSAYSDKEKLLCAIEAGVVKYFIKPFDPEELLEYLCKLSERLVHQKMVHLYEKFRFDPDERKLYRDRKLVHLSKREETLIASLIESPSRFLSYDEVKKQLWPAERVSDERLRTFMMRLRRKSSPELIETVPGRGYRLVLESPTSL